MLLLLLLLLRLLLRLLLLLLLLLRLRLRLLLLLRLRGFVFARPLGALERALFLTGHARLRELLARGQLAVVDVGVQ